MLQLKTTGIKEFIYPKESGVAEECQTDEWIARYYKEFQFGEMKPKIKEGEDVTRFYLKGLSAQVYDRVKELLDRAETVQMEKLCVQYGCVEVKNFIINGVLADSRLGDGLYGKCLPSEIVDAMGFFSALRTRIALLIMEITKSEV